MTTVTSDKDLGKCICASASDKGLGRVEGDVMNGLVVLLPVGCDLLHARPVVQHPQAHRAVVACVGQRQRRTLLNLFKLLKKVHFHVELLLQCITLLE